MAEELTASQLEAISNIERACSVLSLVGCLFVIVTFCLSRSFHKPVNRLVFYATFGNMMTNVGTLMSRSYIESPNSVGCQFQAFLIQMFMPADAFWILAMAINVYLTFYYRFDAHGLRKMEVPYLLCCYGIPFVPALVYVFARDRGSHRAYGNAVLWCWVSTEWNIWRILTFYGPVWVLILITFFIYIRAGRTIYEKRKQLQEFSFSDSDPPFVHTETVTAIKTTEIHVTSSAAGSSGAVPPSLMSPREPSTTTGAYAVTISASGPHSPTIPGQPRSMLPPRSPAVAAPAAGGSSRRRNYELNNAAWAYTKCAILFFTALLITWVPSSANRVYSYVNPGTLPTLEFFSAFVLPLQGFWNALIYAVTSWKACKNLWSDLRTGRRPGVTELMGGMLRQPNATYNEEAAIAETRTPWRMKKGGESESMTGFANSDSHSES